MSTKQKTVLTLLIGLGSLIGGFSHAALNTGGWDQRTLQVNEITPASCDNNQKKVYLDEDNDNDELADKAFFMNNNIMINTAPTQSYNAVHIYRDNTNNSTRVLYFRPYTDMLYKLNSLGYPSTLDSSTFWRASYIIPYQQPARGIATNPNKIVAEKPYDNNTGKNTIGFVFRYQLLTAIDFDGGPISYYQYHAVPSMSYFLDSLATLTTISPNTDRKRDPQLWVLTGCMNFKLQRCGNGIVDTYVTGQWLSTFTGEVCDDGALNGTQSHCNATCSGTGGFFCGDEIINDGSSETVVLSGNGLYYGPTYYSGTELVFETCDDGNDPNDPDGMYNLDGNTMFCSSICFDNFTEAFVEVFINE